MKSIGQRLKKAREDNGLTLEDAQKALKMHPNILRAIEEDRAHEFLNNVYIRNFLKSYARYVGLDAEKIVEEYAEKHAEQPEQVLVLGRKRSKTEDLKTLKKYIPLATRVIIIVLALVIAAVAVKGAFILVKRGAAKASSKISQKMATAKTTQVRKSKEAASAVKKPSISISKNEPLTLVVEAKENAWIEIKSDGNVVFRNVLSKGKVEAWKAKEKIELWVGKAEAVNLVLNGIPLGPPGQGVKKGILITRSGINIP